MYPEEFLYTQDHEWIRVDGNIASVGITDHAQKELGDIVFVELPQVGIYSPVTGEVIAVNPKVQNAPELVNSDPHGEGWLIQLELKDRSETDHLMTAEEYEAYLKGGAAH